MSVAAAFDWRAFDPDIFDCDPPPSATMVVSDTLVTVMTVSDAPVTAMVVSDYLAQDD